MTTITIYSSKQCGICDEVVPAVKQLARRKGVKVEVIDVDKCGERCDWVSFTPLIELNGKQVEVSQLEKILG